MYKEALGIRCCFGTIVSLTMDHIKSKNIHSLENILNCSEINNGTEKDLSFLLVW